MPIIGTDMSDETNAGGLGGQDDIWNITEVIERRAAENPAAMALILADRVLSYRELVTAIHVVARVLLDRGVQPRQTLGVSMGQTALHLVTLLAIARIGAVAVPLHTSLPAARRVQVARRFNVSAVVSGRGDMQLEGWPFISLDGVDQAAGGTLLPPSSTQRDDPCWLSLSSGTTGEPKGVLRTHGYMLDRVGKSSFARGPHSRLLPMDLNFGIGFGQAMRMLVLGGAVVLAPNPLPAHLAYMVRSHAVTHWLVSPALAEEVLALLEDDGIHFPTLDYLQVVGDTPSPRLLDALFRRFTPNVYVAYGVSEIGQIAIADPDTLRRAPASVGRVCPWVRLEVVDGDDRPVPAGQSGRLRVKLDYMFNDYHLDPAHTSACFRDGWYYPRDRARLDAEGLLYIEGREDDVFNIGGGKIYFRDVDGAFETHPAVREAAAFVWRQAAGRDLLAIAVNIGAQVSGQQLLSWAERTLGPQCPERIVFVDSFVRSETGKILRNRLTENFSERT